MAPSPNGSALLEMAFSPDWSFINDVRTFIETFCERAGVNPGRASAVALSVHELLQNAVDYSTDGWARLTLRVDTAQGQITLEVQSHGTPEKIERLLKLNQALLDEPDPLRFYLSLMRETAKRKGSSGLGLGRIRFEGGMALQIKVDEGTVRVIATSSLDAPPSLVEQLRSPRPKETTHG